jgi:hypothetical protein
VTIKHTEDDIRKVIAGALKIPVPSEVPAEEVVPSDDELMVDLLVFAKSHKIATIKKGMSLDDSLNVLDEHTFSRGELTEDEIKLLTTLAMEKCIED